MFGARISLFVGFTSVILSVFFGVLLACCRALRAAASTASSCASAT